MNKLIKSAVAAAALVPLTIGLTGTTASAATDPAGSSVATSIGVLQKGTVLTPAQEKLLSCSKGGYGQSSGWVSCSGYMFKVRVWCTWAGQGLSTYYQWDYNSATCSRGSVSNNSNAIEMIVG